MNPKSKIDMNKTKLYKNQVTKRTFKMTDLGFSRLSETAKKELKPVAAAKKPNIITKR